METLTISERRDFAFLSGLVVREAGQQILNYPAIEIADTHEYKGHESSTIDDFAREKMQAAIDRHLPDFEGLIRFELRPYTRSLVEKEEHHPRVLIIDEIDGTTNTKRCLAAVLEYRPLAVVSIALSLTESLKDLMAGAIYTLDQSEVFSAFRVSGTEFLAVREQTLINPKEMICTRGDSRKRVLVIGYSNSHRLKKGELEQALYDQKFRVYEGCRASAMDVINLLRNFADAYIDLRAFWSTKNDGREKEAMLEIYDIAGVIPIAVGCGLKITDAEGKSWEEYTLESAIPLVVSRPDIHQSILNIIQPLVEKWKREEK